MVTKDSAMAFPASICRVVSAQIVKDEANGVESETEVCGGERSLRRSHAFGSVRSAVRA